MPAFSLESLPVEVLSIIFRFLVIDTTDYVQPTFLDSLFYQYYETSKPLLQQVVPKSFLPLMYVNRFFYEFVKSKIYDHVMDEEFYSAYCVSNPQSSRGYPSCINILSQQYVLPDLFLKVKGKIFPRMLGVNVSKLWLRDPEFSFTNLLGPRCFQGILHCSITHLTSLVLDMNIFDTAYVSWHDSKLRDDGMVFRHDYDFPPFINNALEHLELTTSRQVCTLHNLLQSFVELIGSQQHHVVCTIINRDIHLALLSIFLWVFNLKELLSCVENLVIVYGSKDITFNEFPGLLKKMKNLRNFSFRRDDADIFGLQKHALQSLLYGVHFLDSLEYLSLETRYRPIIFQFPKTLQTLFVSSDFVFSYDLCPLSHTLDNIVDLSISFETDLDGLLNSYAVDLDKLSLKSLTTFRLLVSQSTGLQLASLLVKANTGIKTVVMSMVMDPSRTGLFNFFSELANIERFSFECYYLQPGSSMKYSHILSQIFSNLNSLKELTISMKPYKVSLKSLLDDILFRYRFQTENLTQVSFYNYLDQYSNAENNPMTIFFEETNFDIGIILEHLKLTDFSMLDQLFRFGYLPAKTSTARCENNAKIQVDVAQMRHLASVKPVFS